MCSVRCATSNLVISTSRSRWIRAWLHTSTETLVSEEIDKLYVSPEDGVKLGFILTNMGFARQ